MPTREELHKLVDSLPDGAVEAASAPSLLRIHKGHELTVIERIRIEGQHLLYKHEVNGPGEKHDEREVVFDLVT